MKKRKMDQSALEEGLAAMELLVDHMSRQFLYDASDLDCTVPHQESIYLVAAGPEIPLSIICMEDAQDHHPDFQKTGVFHRLPDVPVMMSYSPNEVTCVANKCYLIGPMIFFRADKKSNIASLLLGDLRYVLKFLRERQEFITVNGECLQAVCLD